MIIYCEYCMNYNGGKGQVCCDFCDPPFYYYYLEREVEDNGIIEEEA